MLIYVQLIRAEYICFKPTKRRGKEDKLKALTNVMVIAGYGQDADESEPHRDLIIRSARFAQEMRTITVYAVGGATNPDFPDKTEADATNRVLLKEFGNHLMMNLVVLRKGNTSADTLLAVKNDIQKRGCRIHNLILACETSRSTGFLMDSLFVGLNELANNIIVFSRPFPETLDEFGNQKKKLLIRLLSHRYKFFHWIRYVQQKHHQRRVAKIKRKLNKS